MINFLKNALSGKGEPSSKRIITFGAFIVMCVVMLFDLMFEITIHEYIYDSFLYIVSVGILSVAAENFSRK